MTRWDYAGCMFTMDERGALTVERPGMPPQPVDDLAGWLAMNYGQDGWQMCSTIPIIRGFLMLFKRPIED